MSYSYKGAAKRFFKAWSNNAMRSKLEPVKKVVKMLRRHEEGLLNFSQHRISNACAEVELGTPKAKAMAMAVRLAPRWRR